MGIPPPPEWFRKNVGEIGQTHAEVGHFVKAQGLICKYYIHSRTWRQITIPLLALYKGPKRSRGGESLWALLTCSIVLCLLYTFYSLSLSLLLGRVKSPTAHFHPIISLHTFSTLSLKMFNNFVFYIQYLTLQMLKLNRTDIEIKQLNVDIVNLKCWIVGNFSSSSKWNGIHWRSTQLLGSLICFCNQGRQCSTLDVSDATVPGARHVSREAQWCDTRGQASSETPGDGKRRLIDKQ